MTDQINHHISPLSLYIKVFLALMALTALTVWVAFYDLGFLNTFVAISIAVVKMCLVAWFFMHLNHSTKVMLVAAVGGLVWLLVMLVLTMTDLAGRSWIPYPEGWL